MRILGAVLGVGLLSAGPAFATDSPNQAFDALNRGVCDLNQAAKSGEPVLLREAEREVLDGLFAYLGACVVADRLDSGDYRRVFQAETAFSGLFPSLPHRLEVLPGGGLPPFTLTLRRSPWPLFLAGKKLAHWRAEPIPGGVRLIFYGPGS